MTRAIRRFFAEPWDVTGMSGNVVTFEFRRYRPAYWLFMARAIVGALRGVHVEVSP